MKQDLAVATKLTAVEQALGIRFHKQSTLLEALTHRSYPEEHPSHSTRDQGRLAHLGDGILQCIVTVYLFERFPDYPESTLSEYRSGLVRNVFLAKVAHALELDRHILVGSSGTRGFSESRHEIASCLLEALIGAIHVDQGMDAAHRFVTGTIILPYLSEVLQEHHDIVSLVEHEARQNFRTTSTVFHFLKEERVSRFRKQYSYACRIAGVNIAIGRGPSKQLAIMSAARLAINQRRRWADMILNAQLSADERVGPCANDTIDHSTARSCAE